jgi:hypothetical protein
LALSRNAMAVLLAKLKLKPGRRAQRQFSAQSVKGDQWP